MNRVLFHSLTIPPDQVSTGKLVADIASKFKEKNLNIEILASTPQYRFDSKKFSDEGLLINPIHLIQLVPITIII